MNILITGGAGYIGSHTCVELIKQGHQPIIFDNFSNSSREVLSRIEKISGRKIRVIEEDIRNQGALEETLVEFGIEAVMHFAALKSVGESSHRPVDYYNNNLGGLISLVSAMQKQNVKHLIYSSSATVYGNPMHLPIDEDHPKSSTNPYATTKLLGESMLQELQACQTEWSIGILRYFNPAGAHESGEIGEDPRGTPNNLMPYIEQVATGERTHLNIWGSDYPTKDGTGVRDYIHVVDLALGHLKALDYIFSKGNISVNLGTGVGYSVLEVIQSFEKISGKSIPFQLAERRPGDVAECFSDIEKSKSLLDWEATRGLQEMCRDSWNWRQKNPNGY